MNFKLSKYIIKTDQFKEQGDQNEYAVLFSCRKKMGIKMNIHLINILNQNLFNKLPDHIFSMLMHYEIIIPDDENEELHLYKTRRLLFDSSHDYEKQEPEETVSDLESFLKKENAYLRNKILKKEFVDQVCNNLEFSFIFSENGNISVMSIDDPELYRTPITNKKKLNSLSCGHNLSYFLPIAEYNSINFSTEQLKSIIENFKLKLMLKYKIEA